MKRISWALIAVMSLLLSACGNPADELAEQIIEAQDGGEVDVDVEGDDSTTVEFSDSDDSGSVTFGNTELPDDFPVDVPDGYSVSSAGTYTSGDDTTHNAILIFEADDFERIVDFYDDYFSGIPDAETTEFTSDQGTTKTWSTADYTTSVAVSADPTQVMLIINVEE